MPIGTSPRTPPPGPRTHPANRGPCNTPIQPRLHRAHGRTLVYRARGRSRRRLISHNCRRRSGRLFAENRKNGSHAEPRCRPHAQPRCKSATATGFGRWGRNRDLPFGPGAPLRGGVPGGQLGQRPLREARRLVLGSLAQETPRPTELAFDGLSQSFHIVELPEQQLELSSAIESRGQHGSESRCQVIAGGKAHVRQICGRPRGEDVEPGRHLAAEPRGTARRRGGHVPASLLLFLGEAPLGEKLPEDDPQTVERNPSACPPCLRASPRERRKASAPGPFRS